MARNAYFTPAASFAGLLVLTGFTAAGFAADRRFATEVAPLLRAYCHDCHAGKSAEGGVDLQSLAAAGRFGSRFKTWEKVAEMLDGRKMPPKDAKQPNRKQRSAMVTAVRRELQRYIKQHAGDPGPVMMRRLTSAEYAYTIRDLTGLDLSLERHFNNDAVGGEGFTNVGGAQFMQDSALERYLEAAKTVASHAVIGSGPLAFSRDPGQTGLELSAIRRIQRIYRQHGFRAGAGEGAEPFGLEMYPKALFVAWQYRHRQALGRPGATLGEIAKTEGISGRFAEHIWRVLNRSTTGFPTSALLARWRALPAANPDRQQTSKIRTGCEEAFRLMRNWQRALAAATGDEEEAAVLTAASFHVQPTHTFKAKLDWDKGATQAKIELAVSTATNTVKSGSIVTWKSPRIRFRRDDRMWSAFRPLSDVLTESSRKRLRFGRHPAGGRVTKDDFSLSAPVNLTLDFNVPKETIAAELVVAVELDRKHGAGAAVRCTVSDGVNEGETIAESGGNSALLVDPQAKGFEAWKQGVLEFARLLPEISHREPAPSDRDPIPPPFDGSYNSTERNLYHIRIKYHRDDSFLVRHILDDAARQRLDRAWVDLLASCDYHDTWLQFLTGKYKLRLDKQTIATLDGDWIAKLPAEPRAYVARLRENYLAGQRQLQAAQPGHIQDALRFAERAWRRPLRDEDKTRLAAFYKRLREQRLDHTQALRALLARILVAPAFLYRVELPTRKTAEVVALSDWELANRLSYFLWSSLPDAELRRVAAAGRLKDPAELARQARRMLRDPKAQRLATEFFGQWFGFYRFDGYRGIDARRFPEFTDSLKTSMYDEAVSFFEHIIRKDRPVREILFADYTFLNPQLAEHYGIPKSGKQPASAMTLVPGVGKHRRGGLLRLGAVLTVTSAPLRTSPVKRGDWILRRVLGTPVPPPPPDAGSIPADDALADGKTVRKRLEAHRRQASCMNCHSRIDPLGFALEHFDAIGRWRDRYRDKQPIDPSGTLNDGTKITGPDGLRRYLQANEVKFRRTLCAKLLGYALGRAEIASDRPLVQQMMADSKAESRESRVESRNRHSSRSGSGSGSGLSTLDSRPADGRFSDLVVRIVTSRQFRHQRVESAKLRVESEKKEPTDGQR